MANYGNFDGGKLPTLNPVHAPAPQPVAPYSSPGSLGRSGTGVGGALSPPDTPQNPWGGTPGYSTTPTFGNGGGGGGVPAPGAGTGWSFASDPSIQIALNNYQRGLTNLTSQFGLESALAPRPYVADPWQAANLRIQQAQQNEQLQEGSLRHQLPIALLGIRNALAAHGLANSGDLGFQTGEANYGFNQQLQGLLDSLSQTTSGEQMQAQQQAAANAAQLAQWDFSDQQQTAKANYDKTTGTQNLQDSLAQALLQAFQSASQDPSVALSSSGASGIPPEVLAILQGRV